MAAASTKVGEAPVGAQTVPKYRSLKIFDGESIQHLLSKMKIADCMQLLGRRARKDSEHQASQVSSLTSGGEVSVSTTLNCSQCSVSFEGREDQRQHYKLDWHRYNLRLRMAGAPAVSEEKFTELADNVSSISGSETDNPGSDSEPSQSQSPQSSPQRPLPAFSKAKALLRRERTSSISSTDTEDDYIPNMHRRHAKVFFENEDGDVFSMYRCILLSKKDNLVPDEDIVKMAQKATELLYWAVIMLGGGHFAAAVFSGKEVVIHKTFHSYTVRAKQGGSQSARDGKSSTSHPKSAGASLRRYNEAALMQHVQDILETWSAELSKCHLIFFRAAGYSRTALFGGKNAPLKKQDPRLRTIPFPTKRATFNEVKRIHDMLTSVEVYGSGDEFRKGFPQAPHKPLRQKSEKVSNESTPDASQMNLKTDAPAKSAVEQRQYRKKTSQKDRGKVRRSPTRPLPEFITALAKSPSSELEDGPLKQSEVELDLATALEEFQIDFGYESKEKSRRSRKKSSGSKNIEKLGEWKEKTELRNKLYTACRVGDVNLLNENVAIILSLQTKLSDTEVDEANGTTCYPILNDTFGENNLTLLHVAAKSGHPEIILALLELGADPSIPDRKGNPPYSVASDKETRNAFRRYMGQNMDKFDYKKAQIPGPLTEEIEQAIAEKKKVQKKAKKEREREKKKEDTEKKRFLALSDREKRAFAAESRYLKQLSASGASSMPVLARCFQCGGDMTGKVPFEYNDFRFCTVQCLKTHRQSHKNS